MRDRRVKWQGLLLGALCVAAASCTTPATAVVFRVISDDLVPRWCDQPGMRGTPQCPAAAYSLGEVLVRVCSGECVGGAACMSTDRLCQSFLQSSTRRSARDDLPGDISVTPRDVSESGTVGVYVRATASDGRLGAMETIERRFVVPFVAERTSLVEVWLESRCFRETCPAGTTCGRVECEPVRDPASQPYTPTPTPGPSDAGGLDVRTLPPNDAVDATAADAPAVTDAVDAPAVVDAAVVDAVDAAVVDAVDATADRFDCGDLSRDPANCGACGRACRGDQQCAEGMCRCSALLSECGGACVNLQRDARHCGGCGRACGSGGLCVNGRCEGGCDAGLTTCDDAGCTDLMSDPLHCGSCLLQCLSGNTCREGVCVTSTVMCARPLSPCGRFCVDTQVDPLNCGACGHACGSRDRCCNGLCTGVDVDASCGS